MSHLTLITSPKSGGYTLELMSAVASKYFRDSPVRTLEVEGAPGVQLVAVTIAVAVEQTTPDWAQARVIASLRRQPDLRRASRKRHANRHTPGRLLQPEPVKVVPIRSRRPRRPRRHLRRVA